MFIVLSINSLISIHTSVCICPYTGCTATAPRELPEETSGPSHLQEGLSNVHVPLDGPPVVPRPQETCSVPPGDSHAVPFWVVYLFYNP